MSNKVNKAYHFTLPSGEVRWGLGGVLLAALLCLTTSCSDFFEQESDHVIYADKARLDNAADTIYSVLGIVNKMQALADRTILLGEMRGDLVDVTSVTSSDLRDVAAFNIGDDNVYNSPRDYYAVINNCNFFLTHVDTELKNNNNEYIFSKEYAAVKAYRAWTYMQLALNYGSVPFVTEPILTKDDAERDYERKDIKQICEYMIADITPYADVKIPEYGIIRSADSRMFYFPINLLLGDMNLWLGNYREAALCYYRYLSTREGTNSVSPVNLNRAYWGSSSWLVPMSSGYTAMFNQESPGQSYDLITMLPGDSIPAEGNYSQLRNLFNTTEDNSYKASIVPSQSLKDLSASQKYCYLSSDLRPVYPSAGLGGYKDGDLRLYSTVETDVFVMSGGGTQAESFQQIEKYVTRNVHLYRRTMVYLRMAEALNRAGFPVFAFKILQSGVNNQVIEDEVIPCYPQDEAWLRQFSFPNTSYVLAKNDNNVLEANTIGLHSMGSGWTTSNEFYTMPENPDLGGQELLNWQMEKVEDMIMDEEALEFAFEGHRFYDLMRVALRRGDPSYLADRIYARRGAGRTDEVKAMIKKDLSNPSNWYLNWNGQIGW